MLQNLSIYLTVAMLLAASFQTAFAHYTKRVICGRVATYVDPYGYQWASDQAYSTGSWGYTRAGVIGSVYRGVIENTHNWEPYRYERWDDPAYQFDGLEPGTYYVKLLYAETYFGLPSSDGYGGGGIGSRVFDILINDQVVMSNYDILADTGERGARAVVKTFKVTIQAGDPNYINIAIDSHGNRGGKLNAIEISDQPTLTAALDNYFSADSTQQEHYRLNCGGSQLLDEQNNFWMSDEPFTLCQRWGYSGGDEKAKQEIDPGAMTVTDTWRAASQPMTYKFHVPNGTYQLDLFFAEHDYQQPGQRRFDVNINGQVLASQLDLVAEAGAGQILTKSMMITVDQEMVEIVFDQITAGQAIINALDLKVMTVTEAAFLDFVSRRSLDYFYLSDGPRATVHPDNGLILDRQHNFVAPLQPAAASIASVGFGLAAVAAGARNGWLDPIQAKQRIEKTVNYFNQAAPYVDDSQAYLTHKNGFYFHFVNHVTGQRQPGSEVSSIDTALLLAGMMTAAGAYQHEPLAATVDQILGRADWQWFAKDSADGFCAMGWMPETGQLFNQWNSYNEGILLTIIGIGVPNKPLASSAWYRMERHWTSYANINYMIEHPTEPTALFTHLYPQCFLDLRNRPDDKNDYFLNTQQAITVDRAFCRQQGHETYQAGGWGLTASDSPQKVYSYSVYRTKAGYHDGTVNPSMVGAAIPFAPEQAIADLRRLYFDYKHFLWGRFGFSNSYNLNAPKLISDAPSGLGWVAADVVGIDQGALILGIENYRRQTVWRDFMAHSAVQQGLAAINVSDLTIDDFDNDQSYSDEALVRDGNWWYSAEQSISLNVVSQGIDNHPTPCLQVNYKMQASQETLLFGIEHLSRPANLTYMAGQDHLSMQVYGHVRFQMNFQDKFGNQSTWSPLMVTQGNWWQEMVWDISQIDWQDCDAKQIEKISIRLLAVDEQSSLQTAYFDNVKLGRQVESTIDPIGQFKMKQSIHLFPNPAREQVKIAFPAKSSRLCTLDVFNMVGERITHIREKSQALNQEVQQLTWQLKGIAPGIYLVRIAVTNPDGSRLVEQVRKIAVVK